MCTVTFLPLSHSSFILTHNRDEHHTRSIALLPERNMVYETEIVFPKDEQGGGTWFASSKEFTLCLLNGGFEKHISSPPYKHSRGLVIVDFFRFNDVNTFKESYDFAGIEPFTLIIIQHSSQQIHQFIKDEKQIHYSLKDNMCHQIWSSTSLYTGEDINKRVQWFNEWKRNHSEFTQSDIIEFHKRKHDDVQQEGIMINRNAVLFTVSLTSVYKNEEGTVAMKYEDFLQHKKKELVI